MVSTDGILRTRKEEDFEKMATYAAKITREWSLKELGYDITVNNDDEERGFFTKNHQVKWSDKSCYYPKNIPVGDIILQISHHFPDMELWYIGLYESMINYSCIIKNGVETEVKWHCLGFCFEKVDDLRRIADMAHKNEALYHIEKVIVKEDQGIVLMYFKPLTKDELEANLSTVIDSSTKLLPQSDFYCFLVENNDMGDRMKRKAHVKNGQAKWHDFISKQEDRPVFYEDFDESNPFVEEITSEVAKAILSE